jgi:hypothetical protein
MKRGVTTVAIVFLLSSIGVSHDLSEKKEIKKTLRYQGSTERRSIVVDNIKGSIDVRGYDGDSVELVVHRTNYADSQDKLVEANDKVILDIKEEKDRILLYVDAPWRTSDGINYRGWQYYGYDVQCDFELKVPTKTDVYIKTVNDGEILVQDVKGEFEVQNVNGGIDMENVAGTGKVCTVNGPVKVVFSKNPDKDCSFKTVNGRIDVECPNELSAEMKFKTFNGNVYTDYDVTALPKSEAKAEMHHGRKTYLTDKSFSVQVGKGGPELAFETLNGSIHVLKREE